MCMIWYWEIASTASRLFLQRDERLKSVGIALVVYLHHIDLIVVVYLRKVIAGPNPTNRITLNRMTQ